MEPADGDAESPAPAARPADRLAAGPARPTAAELALLTRGERLALALGERMSRGVAKRAANAFLATFAQGWVRASIRNLVRTRGDEILAALPRDRGVLLVSNHRSYFDLYVLSSMWRARTGHLPRLYFPVRSTFFYDHPLGPLVNLAMAAFAMYPPVFRQPQKRGFNRYSVARIAELLREPDTLVGMHPEGTRGKGPDPYALLPAQPGVGQIILEARPTVLPAFVHGLGNGLLRQMAGNLTGRGEPILIVWGRPLDLDSFYAQPPRLRTRKAVADHVLDEIRRLGEIERSWRAALATAASSQEGSGLKP